MTTKRNDYERAVEAISRVAGISEEDVKNTRKYIDDRSSKFIATLFLPTTLFLFGLNLVSPSKYQKPYLVAISISSVIGGLYIESRSHRKSIAISEAILTYEKNKEYIESETPISRSIAGGLDETLNKLPTGFLD